MSRQLLLLLLEYWCLPLKKPVRVGCILLEGKKIDLSMYNNTVCFYLLLLGQIKSVRNSYTHTHTTCALTLSLTLKLASWTLHATFSHFNTEPMWDCGDLLCCCPLFFLIKCFHFRCCIIIIIIIKYPGAPVLSHPATSLLQSFE